MASSRISRIRAPQFWSFVSFKSVRRLSTSTPDGHQESPKVEEAETVHESPPHQDRLLVLGGNGFVGTHVCKEGLQRGLTVSSLSRSGKPAVQEPWVNDVTWYQGNLLDPEMWKDALDGVSAVISCVGGFGSNEAMFKINGTANIKAIQAASESGVKRFVYISAAEFGIANFLLRGYFEGKRAAEKGLLSKFPYGGVILRPGFIYGTRQVGSFKIPLGIVGSPLETVLRNAKSAAQVPVIGPLFLPPVNASSVAKVAVRAATDAAFPPGIIDVWGIIRHADH
uniref:NAD(P)-binding domain-containing protein n=1 Tax=Araucaria cunninghamii TaxID=56994 RepID=A0A0D6QXS1_ARACU